MKMLDHKGRFLLVLSVFIFILCILIWRMYDLTVMNRQFLLSQGDARSVRIVDLPAYRGMITDRNGIPLAVSTPVKSVWINPKQFSPTDTQFKQLAALLNLSKSQLLKQVKGSQKREFIYLKRQVFPSLAKKIASLNIKGINFQQEFKRYYPQAESSAQLVGFTNVDDDGLEGVEFAYQQWLKGVSGKKRVVKDRLGRVIEALDILQEPQSGHDLSLSIDSRIQYFAYRELKQTIEKFSAKTGSVVVLDTQNGEVLAIVNYPSFNPNARSHYPKERYRNKAITDLFEPGSVMKPFSIASALESGLFKPDSLIDTRPSWMMLQVCCNIPVMLASAKWYWQIRQSS